METGTVKFFNESKGFGFITQEDGKEIFVHVSGLKQDIRQNDKVEFEVEEGKKGLSAVNVRLAYFIIVITLHPKTKSPADKISRAFLFFNFKIKFKVYTSIFALFKNTN